MPSLALGTGEVSLLDLTSAYTAFANGGVLQSPTFVRRVEDADGRVLYRGESVGRRVLSESTAFLMASMLSDVVNHGTGYSARQNGFTLPAGGKTGTTDDHSDAWFIGFTPNLAAGVWVGYDQPQPIVRRGLRERRGGPGLGRLHERRDAQRQGRVGSASRRHQLHSPLPRDRVVSPPNTANCPARSTTTWSRSAARPSCARCITRPP